MLELTSGSVVQMDDPSLDCLVLKIKLALIKSFLFSECTLPPVLLGPQLLLIIDCIDEE